MRIDRVFNGTTERASLSFELIEMQWASRRSKYRKLIPIQWPAQRV